MNEPSRPVDEREAAEGTTIEHAVAMLPRLRPAPWADKDGRVLRTIFRERVEQEELLRGYVADL